MKVFPKYLDIFAIANLHKGGFPCTIFKQTIKENISLHHHDFLELGLVLEGRGTEIINGKPYLIKPGMATFLLPHHLHEIHITQDESIVKYCCMFDISILFGAQADADLGNLLLKTGHTLPPLTYFNEEDTLEMKLILKKIQNEFHSNQIAKNSLLRAKLIEALVMFVRSHQDIPSNTDEHLSTEKPRTIWDIIQYVNTHYMFKLSLESLSHKFNMNVSTISQSFKEEMGQNFLEYMHHLRIRRASGLLLNTDMSIVEIAEESGFESFRTFSRVFKEIKGMTASQFRNFH